MTAPLPRVRSVEEVADALGETGRFVKDKCRAREWPHVKLGRGRIAFTDEQYARVLELIATPVEDTTPRGLSFAPRSRRGAA